MANHGYIFAKELPDAETINKDVQEIVARKFPMFIVNFDPEAAWHEGKKGLWNIIFKNEDPNTFRIGIQFWMSERERYEYDEEKDEEGELIDKLPCIEFKHGHGSQFLWWLEYEIREELATRYNCTIADDGDGEENPPHTKRYNTFYEYFSDIHKGLGIDIERFQKLVAMELEFAREWMPEETHVLIGSPN
jgi:hypothetical protein